MNRRQMIDRFQSVIDDIHKGFWNDVRITALLNDAKDRIAQEMKVNDTQCYYTFDSVEGQEWYQVPYNLVKHGHLLYNQDDTDREIFISTNIKAVRGNYYDSDNTGYPSNGYFWARSGRRELHIAPTFDEDGITCEWYFFGWPEDISGDGDEFSLPISWHPTILRVARELRKVEDGDMNKVEFEGYFKLEMQSLAELESTTEASFQPSKTGRVDAALPDEPAAAAQEAGFMLSNMLDADGNPIGTKW